MKKSLLIVFLILFISPFAVSGTYNKVSDNRSTSEILSQLDRLLKDRHIYEQKRIDAVDSLRRIIAVTETAKEIIRLSLELADVQRHISTDSTIATLDRSFGLARSIKDSVAAEKIVILRAREYFNLGHVHEAFLDLDYALRHGVHPHNWFDYHDVSRYIYMTLGLLNDYRPFDDDLTATGLTHAQHEKSLLSKDDPLYFLCDAYIALGNDDKIHLKMALDSMMVKIDETHSLYNTANALLGQYHASVEEEDLAIRYLALAAISDTYRGNLDGAALLQLGEILANTGEYNRANSYLSVALANALRSGTRFNLMRVSEAFVDTREQIEKERHMRLILLIGAIVILLSLCIIIVRLIIEKRKEVVRLRETERLLASSNLAKDTYIEEFLNLCSDYIESLEVYNRVCRRKIQAGQTTELLEIVKSGSIIDDQRKKFFDVFDRAFLHLFPDFVNDVNDLLIPDRRFIIPGPGLTTELRIIALSILGIEDATKIADFLGISTNTIYTYRNKMRSKAINRNTFDSDIRHIKGV